MLSRRMKVWEALLVDDRAGGLVELLADYDTVNHGPWTISAGRAPMERVRKASRSISSIGRSFAALRTCLAVSTLPMVRNIGLANIRGANGTCAGAIADKPARNDSC